MTYFENFKKKKQVVGIPGVRMNVPIAPVYVTGDVGIEFEIEASNSLPWATEDVNKNLSPDPKTGAVWLAKEDNSLRGGAEYVTSSAVSVDYASPMLYGLYSNLKAFKSSLRFSNRCSTHVHLNASSWRINTLVSFVTIWSLLEAPLIDWCGPKRKSNHFCLSINDSSSTVDAVTNFLRTGQWNYRDGLKYSALNILRLFDIGTVEIRCGDAWQDPERTVAWVRLLNEIKRYAESVKNPEDIPGEVSGLSPLGLLKDLTDKAGAGMIYEELTKKYDEREFNRMCYQTFRETIHLCYHPWSDWLPEIEKEYIKNPFGGKSKHSLRDFADDLIIPAPQVVGNPGLEAAIERVNPRVFVDAPIRQPRNRN